MTELCFSDGGWAAIVVHIPKTDPDKFAAARQRLEAAAHTHLFQGAIRSAMTDPKGKREKWRRVQSAADALRKAIGALDEWSLPNFGPVDQRELEHDASERDHWTKELETLSHMATENLGSCDSYVKRKSDRSLSDEILCVWADVLNQKLGITRGRDNKVRGPLWNFFKAVASPILGEQTPKPETFAKMVNDARHQRLRGGDGKKKSKRPARAPCPMVP